MGGLFFHREKLKVSCGKKGETIEVVKIPFWYEGLGLMFKKKENARALLFLHSFSSQMRIHSYFVRFNFLAIWLDKKNNLVGLDLVKPNKEVKSKKKFRKLVEVPINKNYKSFVEFTLKNKSKKLTFNFVDDKS